jgi:sugar phosphate isomerase/epimerase
MGDPVHVPTASVALSTASVYPESTTAAFEIAARLGYDGVEVMVSGDAVSQDVAALQRLSDYHQVPVVAIHSPCLLITQRVWGSEPWGKLQTARKVADALGASVVVVHPPFRWQREYAKSFVQGIGAMNQESDVRFAVENMFPWRARTREVQAYLPDHDPTDEDYEAITLDLSHTAVSGSDAMQMATGLAQRLTHVHLGDGTGSARDEHLVPGRGSQPCAELLGYLADVEFSGHVVLEVNTRKATSRAERENDLAEAVAFTRLHLATRGPVDARE